MSLSPCWYWMPIASQPKRSAMRIAARVQPELVEHLVLGQLGGAVAAEAGSACPRPVSQPYAARASPVVTSRISATRADWLQALLVEARRVEVARHR